MSIQVRNDEMISLLSADLQPRYEPNFAWKSAYSSFQALTGLRGFWPMAAFDTAGYMWDHSGYDLGLTLSGNVAYNYDGLAPTADMDGSGDFLYRTDHTGLDISGTETYVASAVRGLTFGGWWRSDDVTAHQGLMSKEEWSPNLAYHLRIVSSAPSCGVSSDGLNWQATQSGGALTDDTWYFIVARLDPSTELALFQSGTWYRNTTSIPASVFNNTATFTIGRFTNGGGPSYVYLDGSCSLCFICAAMLSDTIVESLWHQSRAMFGV